MKALRYKGEFLTVKDNVCRVELWQETDAPWVSVGTLRFPLPEPLTITWEESTKENAVERSHARLKLVSPGDRTYTDLYSEQASVVRMDVYIDNSLYWSGTLDREYYSEPYEQLDDYEVELPFSDLGVLGQKEYIDYGLRSLRDIVEMCVNAADIRHETIDWYKTFTRMTDGRHIADGIGVDASNWTTSEGEQQTMLSVLEGMLQPLGLKIRQKAGRIYVYDLHYLAREGQESHGVMTRPVVWSGTSQELSGDRIYNKLKIEWSTYVREGALLDDDIWGDNKPDPALVSYVVAPGGQGCGIPNTWDKYYSMPSAPLQNTHSLEDSGFTLWTRPLAAHGELEGALAMMIVAQNTGSEQKGIAISWAMPAIASGEAWGAGYSHNYGLLPAIMPTPRSGATIYRSEPVEIPAGGNDQRLQMRLRLPVLMSARTWLWGDNTLYTGPEESRHKSWDELWHILYVPVQLSFVSHADGQRYIWKNRDIIDTPPTPRNSRCMSLKHTQGEWVPQKYDNEISAYLAYYEDTLFEGGDKLKTPCYESFTGNRPCIYPTIQALTKAAEKYNGQPVPWPPAAMGGTLTLTVQADWTMRAKNMPVYLAAHQYSVEDFARMPVCTAPWLLIGVPELEVEPAGYYDDSLDTSDVTYELDINPRAKDELTLRTVCGTSASGVPGARGAYIDMETGLQVRAIKRDSNEGTAEELLGMTLLAQYWHPMARISGEARADIGPLMSLTERCTPGVFLVTSEEQDIHQMTSEIVITQFTRDILLDYGN